MYKLVIVESPNKVETIKKYLGEGYEVAASVGHITKLATSGDMGLGIDFENWEPNYILDPKKRDVVKKLKDLVKNADEVLIATDPDREGEAIGEHLVKKLKIEKKYKRIKYNEITKDAILKAVAKPGLLDQALIDAQKARRMLDRIIGFRLSKLMKQKLSNSPTNPSAGRVQSIALKLIVDREKEIEAFVPVGYNKLEAVINNNISANIYFENHEGGEKDWIYLNELDNVKEQLTLEPTNILKVIDINQVTRRMKSMTPLKQSVLYKKSPFTSRATQSAAQHLYEGYGEGGLISYPRTDSTRLSQTFINNAKKYVENKFGKEYVLEEIKGIAGDQDAHEAIRPTDISLTPDMAKAQFDLNNYDYQIYKLIYEHTLQCLISPPIRTSKSYTLVKNELVFKFNASKIDFDGYYVIKDDKEEKVDPNWQEGQEINVVEYLITDHETKPPARYTEGSLIEALDLIKVGRPSTFASTVKIVLDREYAENIDKTLKPTEFGRLVLEKLLNGFPDIINEGYTAEVEEELDLIAENKTSVQPVMSSFYSKFTKSYDDATVTLQRTIIEPEVIDEKCPEDNGDLVVKKNRFGTKFIGCSNFPNCRFTRSIPGQKKSFKKFWSKKTE
ncbi:type I DNA topoisomerase [Mycoplasma sp. Mirounga ES2805-ORL]|uniref:type I DNA topoisomerase n=1 Tax=Mycoplasma sp. Mirounga ES2805-ORL TaxID=754514 RepID=UPI00197C811B|nr:type I DNA topoisomerase [Mycoplasma sp. Mirounga ES2805-ORL]QSF13430.1 type I DNA topoisomerase [Mycoplasma sp. Mirounga ES2805-ORL]